MLQVVRVEGELVVLLQARRMVHPELHLLQPPVGIDVPAARFASVGGADGVDLAFQIRKLGDVIARVGQGRRAGLERQEESHQRTSHLSCLR